MSDAITIRDGRKEDVPRILELIRELAHYEKADDEVENTVARLEEDGFGDTPLYFVMVAELDGAIIGMSLCYFRYSTWKGKSLFMEDLIVSEAARGKGAGKALLDATIAKAKDTGSTQVCWQVLDWNQPAIDFYKTYNATFDKEWLNCTVRVG
ncbi:MAG: GNAT family N-acetyltransferase [Candidatus Hydrogenedentota bacterium]|nr:MAG: GNAT family N-acetyltransferase [Candidatus Hydrogenedentota bacterium]